MVVAYNQASEVSQPGIGAFHDPSPLVTSQDSSILGGRPAALNKFLYQQDDGMHEPPMASKMVGIRLKRGQRLHLESPGGGGYGPPEERAPQAVADDVRLGYVSSTAAARDYGVALAEDGAVDLVGTARLRKKAAE